MSEELSEDETKLILIKALTPRIRVATGALHLGGSAFPSAEGVLAGFGKEDDQTVFNRVRKLSRPAAKK